MLSNNGSAFLGLKVYLHFTVIASGDIDYFSINTTSTIPAGTSEMSVMVKTQKNRLMDPLEYFFADLSVPGECDNVDLGTKTANITIVDISGESVGDVTELAVSLSFVHTATMAAGSYIQ